MVVKKNHVVGPRESCSSGIGISKRPVAVIGGGNTVKLSDFGDLLKKRMVLADINNTSGKKNSGKPLLSIRTKEKNMDKKLQKENITRRQPMKKASPKQSPTLSKVDDESLRCSSSFAPNPMVVNQNNVVSPKESQLLPLNLSVSRSEGDSMSLAETSSISSYMKSPDFEYIDNVDSSVLPCLERHVNVNVHFPGLPIIEAAHYSCKDDDSMTIETSDDVVVDVDWNHEDPQLCATLTCDIYKHLREAEVNYFYNTLDKCVIFFFSLHVSLIFHGR